MQASQCGPRREGRMSFTFINVYREIILFRILPQNGRGKFVVVLFSILIVIYYVIY
jgi:hypothetical protein